MLASELFREMGNCSEVNILGTRLDSDLRMNETWDNYGQIHKVWKGQILSMQPESSGGLSWLIDFKERLGGRVVKLYVRCEGR